MAHHAELLDRVSADRLDPALSWDAGKSTPHRALLGELPMCRIGARSIIIADVFYASVA